MDEKEMINSEGNEWNKMKRNQFNFIVVWIVKDKKECNENKSYLDKKKKKKMKGM